MFFHNWCHTSVPLLSNSSPYLVGLICSPQSQCQVRFQPGLGFRKFTDTTLGHSCQPSRFFRVSHVFELFSHCLSVLIFSRNLYYLYALTVYPQNTQLAYICEVACMPTAKMTELPTNQNRGHFADIWLNGRPPSTYLTSSHVGPNYAFCKICRCNL